MLGESGLPLVDASEGIGRALAVKDAAEIKNVKKAAFLATGVMNGMAVPQIEGAGGGLKATGRVASSWGGGGEEDGKVARRKGQR